MIKNKENLYHLLKKKLKDSQHKLSLEITKDFGLFVRKQDFFFPDIRKIKNLICKS